MWLRFFTRPRPRRTRATPATAGAGSAASGARRGWPRPARGTRGRSEGGSRGPAAGLAAPPRGGRVDIPRARERPVEILAKSRPRRGAPRGWIFRGRRRRRGAWRSRGRDAAPPRLPRGYSEETRVAATPRGGRGSRAGPRPCAAAARAARAGPRPRGTPGRSARRTRTARAAPAGDWALGERPGPFRLTFCGVGMLVDRALGKTGTVSADFLRRRTARLLPKHRARTKDRRSANGRPRIRETRPPGAARRPAGRWLNRRRSATRSPTAAAGGPAASGSARAAGSGRGSRTCVVACSGDESRHRRGVPRGSRPCGDGVAERVSEDGRSDLVRAETGRRPKREILRRRARTRPRASSRWAPRA